jgi:hypothetical protein
VASYIQAGLTLGYLIALVPGAIAVYFLDRPNAWWPTATAVSWVIAFAALAIYLHRHGVVHIASSIFCAVAAVGAAAYLSGLLARLVEEIGH